MDPTVIAAIAAAVVAVIGAVTALVKTLQQGRTLQAHIGGGPAHAAPTITQNTSRHDSLGDSYELP